MTDSHTSVREELLGLPDRRLMRHAIDSARERLAAGGHPSAVLLVEVAGLASGGEQPAAELAARLAAALHPDDLVGRFAGDVLVVVASDVADEDDAHALAARLTDASSVSDAGLPRLATAGFTVVRDGDPSVATVVARADAALYAAKNKASRDAREDVPAWVDSSREALVEAAFERSTVEDFDVYYQPIVDVRDGSIAAVEAILRWEHPDLGTIAPNEFLGLIDRRGQMVTLGRWTIEKACAQTVRWGATRDGLPMRTCVNVAGVQVTDPAFVEDVTSALARHGAMTHQLALELTEEALAAMPAPLQAALAGARLSLVLDHEGSHLPSHAGLERVPVAMIKLDRSLLAEDGLDDPSSPLHAAAQLARGLGLPCVAKGVETRAQLRAVRDCGVPFAQGYLFSKPQSAAAIEELVFRERPFGSLVAPPPMLLGLELDGLEPAIELGAPAVP
jgi:EAL domain-containing protein (putative c-di-GMP-specific phosphodiesterase class I)/GGDEF domain-containing protein